jgi:hypothetical protein
MFADDLGGMKRLALTLVALGVVGSSAFVVGAAQAYQPVEDEIFYAFPDTVALGGTFDAVVENCFPGELVVFFNFGVTPNDSDTDTCDLTTFTASVTFQAPLEVGEYEIGAFLDEGTSENPDIPDRPFRFLRADYTVVEDPLVIVPGSGDVEDGPTAMSVGGSGGIWPSFMSSAGFYRTFLALFALIAGIFFVVLWRRRREDERLEGAYVPGGMPPADPSNPSLA